ncbi:putative accessory movement protein [Thin paspalum asymptomatic virus]|uniref:Putative accessory movement protein n=1 Tax=Thin paspalum asymptomatic virus TaxID=1352511 RepID=S4WDW2_9TOMB|nr:putative accessory movement protein [Thin paspalum asymptomatic virus]AGO96559.1 putative accessory movement protein [Thin paspalum asymptomatic virus]
MELPTPEEVVSVHHRVGPADVLEASLWNGEPPQYSMLQLWARHNRAWAQDKDGREFPTRKSYFKSLHPLPPTAYKSYQSSRGCLCPQLRSPSIRVAHHICVKWGTPSPSTDGGHSALSGSPAVLQRHQEIWF